MMQDYERELSAIKKLLKNNPNGMSVTDISRALKKNKNTVGRYLDILLISGQVDMRTYGMAKVFTLSQRVPLSAMLSYSKELIVVLDEDRRIVDANDRFLQILALERADVIGKNIGFVGSRNADVGEMFDTIAKTRTPDGEGTVAFRIGEGGERIFNVKRIPTVFEDGGKGSTVVLEDITGRILAEREIRTSEERFRMMADNIQDGLIIIENNRCVYVNTRIASITGYTFDELGMMDPLSCIAPESRRHVREKIRNMEATRRGPDEIQAWIVRKDGERRFVYVRTTTMQHGEKSYAFVIITDITELKEKEAALTESGERFRLMAENVRDGLVIVENNAVVFANRRMTEITGFSQKEMMEVDFLGTLACGQQPIPELAGVVSTDIGEFRLEDLVRNTRPGTVSPAEATLWITRKDGTRRCIQGSFTVSEKDGVVSIYITATDITAFAEKEHALRDRIASLQELVS